MNERIKELRKQAQKYVLDIPASLSPAEFDDMFEEKFSELIVKECARQAIRVLPLDIGLEASLLVKNHLYKHFGVDK